MEKLFIVTLFLLLGSFVSSQAQATATVNREAEDRWAYEYVASICRSYAPVTVAELKSMSYFLSTGMQEAMFDTENFAQRMALKGPTPDLFRELLQTDGFMRGIHDCYPQSENSRNLLALRIILLNSSAIVAGDVAGFVGTLKIFSAASQLLGAGTNWVFKTMGLSDKFIGWLNGIGKASTYAVVGGTAIAQGEEILSLYERKAELERSQEERSAEMIKLNEMEKQTLAAMKEPHGEAEMAVLQNQLNRIRKLTLRINNLNKKAQEKK